MIYGEPCVVMSADMLDRMQDVVTECTTPSMNSGIVISAVSGISGMCSAIGVPVAKSGCSTAAVVSCTVVSASLMAATWLYTTVVTSTVAARWWLYTVALVIHTQ